MKNRSAVSRIILVIFSNLIKLASGILVGFLVPKLLGLDDYGYYKVFGLYTAYIGLFHFGFIDGIYLKFGGANYDELNKNKFRVYFKFLVVLEMVITSLGIIGSLIFLEGEYRTILLFLSLSLLITNLTTYFQFISQITSRFKEFSTRTIIFASLTLVITLILYFFKIGDYRVLILVHLFISLSLLLWYIYTYRDIVFGKSEKIKSNFPDILFFFKTGIILLIANLASTVIVSLDRQVVQYFFPIEDFAIYSFAYSMISIITTAVSAISIVLYPIMKRKHIEEIKQNYSAMNFSVILTVVVGLVAYFPLLYVVPWLLPKYIGSLEIFQFALPALIFTSSISAVKHNIFKATNKENHFFLIGISVLVLTLGLNIGAYYLFKTMVYITISSMLGFFVWYLITEIYLVKKYKVKWKKNLVVIILSLVVYFVSTLFGSTIIGGATFYFSYVVLLIIMNYSDLEKVGLKFNKKQKKDKEDESKSPIDGLSVIITYYKGDNYIDFLLGSLEKSLEHIDIPHEIIIIDDNPDENSLHQYVKKYSDITVIKNDVNKGIANSRNVGLNSARFDFVHVIDQDDLVDEMFYKEIFKKHKKMYVSNKMIYKNGTTKKSYKKLFKLFFKSVSVQKMFEIGNIFSSVGCCIFDKNLLKKGFLDSVNRGSDDFYMYIELIHNTKRRERGFVEKAHFVYRVHETNASKSSDFNKSSVEIFEVFELLYPDISKYKKMFLKSIQKNSFPNLKKRAIRRVFLCNKNKDK